MEEAGMNAIPREVALRLCEEIRAACRGRWHTFSCWQCWGCTTFTGANPDKRCFNNAPGNRGCQLVNRRHDGKRT
jgi:hypothetical protein